MNSKKALILTNHMAGYTGSEMVALEVYEVLVDIGYRPIIYCNVKSGPFASMKWRGGEIRELDNSCLPNIFEFDLVWSQHGLLPILLEKNKLPNKINTKIVSCHLSPYDELEKVGVRMAMALSAMFVANSNETADDMEFAGIPRANIINLFNACPDKYGIGPRKTNANVINNIAIISNHVPGEIFKVARLMKKNGINVIIYGRQGRVVKIEPRIIQNLDAVISIGKSCQYAIRAGVPVYCYDRFGGPGWLSADNFEKAELFNFSGRCVNSRKSPQIIFDEIIGGWKEARDFAQCLIPMADEKYSLERIIVGIVNATHQCIPEKDYNKVLHLEASIARLIRRQYVEISRYSIKKILLPFWARCQRIFRRLNFGGQ